MTDISIITPSFNMLDYLKRCYRSVKDQEGVAIEHIVRDGGSNDGTVKWLESKNDLHWFSEPDDGMYDAINKGWSNAEGNIIAYLNCDEQYLEGTLSFVNKFFHRNPEIDILFGNTLIVNPKGELISYRKGYTPRWFYILTSHLYVMSCTMFLRRGIFEDGFRFDTNYKASADAELVVRLLQNRYKAKHINKYFSAFTWTGQNKSTSNEAKTENKRLFINAPFWIRMFKYPINFIRYFEKFKNGAYLQQFPISYSIYKNQEDRTRTEFIQDSATWKWIK